MDQAADFSIEGAGVGARLKLTGDWTAHGLGRAGERLETALEGRPAPALDLMQLGRIDSAGAFTLMRAGGVGPATEGVSARPDVVRLVGFVGDAMREQPAPAPRRPQGLFALLVRIGRAVAHMGSELLHLFIFYGRLVTALSRAALDPRRLRLAPSVALMERAGLDALPIVVATTFFVGATIGFLGEDLLQQFGAQVFSVELIGIGVLREFAVLITAVILAGRSASSFAAEIGAMKMNQEVDAIQVLGVDPFEALVLPRFIAMLTMTPLLTFAAMLAGLSGGMVVVWAAAGLSPAFFIQRMLENVGVRHFWIGMSKAPVMAVLIAAIGCRQGMEVGGDVEQLGRRVTAAVVQALFAIILTDALFALLFLELGE